MVVPKREEMGSRRRWWSALAACLTLAVATAGCASQRAAAPAQPAAKEGAPAQQSSAPSMTLKFSHVVAKDTPKHKAAEEFAKIVKQKSNGKIDVQVFANSELYKDGEEIEALQTGGIHFIAPGTDKFGVIAGEWEATALPYLFTNDEASKKFVAPDNEIAKGLNESLRSKGLLGMGIWLNGFKHFSDSKRPLKMPADFQGLKFRTSGKPDEAFVKALGGNAQVMAFSEVFGALQQGVVDGQYNTWSNIYTQKFHEVQKYATASRGGALLTYGVATNAKWYDDLDADTRKLITESMNEATTFHNKISEEENTTALAEIKKSGRLEIYEQTAEESEALAKVAETVWMEWEPKTGKEIIDKLRSLNK